jgi:tetratricopeptide (TPR) repeat protein
LPESLDAVMAAEIDTLRPHTRRLLRYCSVLGRSFRRVVLDELFDDEDVGLDPATSRELARFMVVEGPDRLRFRHAVMQSAAYQGLSYKRRRELHQRAGDAIERLAGDDPDSAAEFLTIHFTIAGNAEKAWKYSCTAGHRAQATFANVEAEGHYRRALDAWARLPQASVAEKVDILTRLGDVREQAGMLDQALGAFREALSLSRGDASACADLHLRCALVHMRSGSYRAALAATTRARRLVEPGASPECRRGLARVESAAAVVRMSQERPREAERLARAAASLAEDADEGEALAKAYVVLDWALWMQGRSQEAVFGPEAMRIYESLSQPVQAASVMNNLGAYAYFDGRWDDATEWYRLGVESYRRGGYESGAALARANSAEVLINQGHLDRAAELIDDAVRVLVASGNDDDAMFALIQRARLWCDRGDVAAAIGEFEVLLSKATEMKRNATSIEIAIHLARAHLRAGDTDTATRIVADISSQEPSGFHLPTLALIQADLAAGEGDLEAAIGCLERGLEAAADWGLVYESALLGAQRIRVLRAAGRGVDADDEAQMHSTMRRLGVVRA